MMGGLGRVRLPLALAGGLMAMAGCAPLGAMDVLSGVSAPGVSVVDGEVRSVDPRRSTFQVRDLRNRAYTVRFDRATRVIYRQRDYPVHALERGDVVRVRVSRDRNGTLWADRVDVRQNVRDRGGLARIERVSGRVSHVDVRRGHFVLELGRRESLVVHMPPRVPHNEARRFQRLRRGDGVRVEVHPLGRGAAELVRFR